MGPASHAICDDLSPKEILHKADESRGNLEGIKWSVQVDSVENNEKQDRLLNVSARGYDFLAILMDPPKVRGHKLLMIDHNMWYMKPGLKKPVPISSKQKLVGGAAYGDIAATNYANDYEPTPLAEETVNGLLCYVFDLKAINKKTTYDQIKYWIDKERLVGVKADFYTVSGKLFKSATFEYDNQIVIDSMDRPFISKMTITDAMIEGNITHLIFIDQKIMQLPDSTFDLNLFMTR
jgi:hypothetical protein